MAEGGVLIGSVEVAHYYNVKGRLEPVDAGGGSVALCPTLLAAREQGNRRRGMEMG